MVDNAIATTEKPYITDFQRFLFMLDTTITHELVHVFIGYLTGTSEPDTPDRIQHPPRPSAKSSSKSGKAWEG